MFQFREQQFTAICNAKHAHYFFSVGDKVGGSSRRKHVLLQEIEDIASKKLGLEIFTTLNIKKYSSDQLPQKRELQKKKSCD